MANFELDFGEFVDDAELPEGGAEPEPQAPQTKAPSTSQSGGYVCGKSLMACSSEMPERHRSDVLESMLFCQMVANHQAPRFQSIQDWYRAYWQAIGQVGWALEVGDFDEQHPVKSPFLVHAESTEFFQRSTDDPQGKIVGNLVQALRDLPEDNWRKGRFERAVQGSGLACYQFGTASSEGDNIFVEIAAFELTGSHSALYFLDESLNSSDAKLRASFVQGRLSSSNYAHIRSWVAENLGSYVDSIYRFGD